MNRRSDKQKQKSRPRRGGDPNSGKDQFVQYDFLSALMNTVHPGNPAQLIRCFQLFVDSFSFGHPGDYLFHTIPADLICFHQMVVQLTGKKKPFVQSGAMFLQVSFPHPAIVADSLPRRIREVEIRKVVVAMQSQTGCIGYPQKSIEPVCL